MTRLRPLFIQALEHGMVTSTYHEEVNRLSEEHESALKQLETEYAAARAIGRGLTYPEGTPAYEMTLAEIKSQKVMNGFDPEEPITYAMLLNEREKEDTTK